jgi:hypothetical protein
MTTIVKTYVATGRLPVWDEQLGWIYPKENAYSETPPRADKELADAASQYAKANGTTYLKALRAVAQRDPDLLERYNAEARSHLQRPGAGRD